MDYKAFFADILNWIQQVNQAAMQHGMDKPEFWQWVADSCGDMERKYKGNRLVILQMVMMVEWLDEVHEKRRASA